MISVEYRVAEIIRLQMGHLSPAEFEAVVAQVRTLLFPVDEEIAEQVRCLMADGIPKSKTRISQSLHNAGKHRRAVAVAGLISEGFLRDSGWTSNGMPLWLWAS